MREYETTIIVQPEISDEGSAAIFGRLDSVLTDHDSIRLMNENLGKRKLAYEIKKFHKGHYYVYSFLSDGQVVPALERGLRLNESVLRFMTVLANPKVRDTEARKAEAAELEAEHARKAAERAAREEEEAKARAEEEAKSRAELQAAAAAAAQVDAEATDAESAGAEATDAEATGAESAPAEDLASEAPAPEPASQEPEERKGEEDEVPPEEEGS